MFHVFFFKFATVVSFKIENKWDNMRNHAANLLCALWLSHLVLESQYRRELLILVQFTCNQSETWGRSAHLV